MEVNWALGESMNLQFLTASTNQTSNTYVDWDNTQYTVFNDIFANELDLFSQEIQLSGQIGSLRLGGRRLLLGPGERRPQSELQHPGVHVRAAQHRERVRVAAVHERSGRVLAVPSDVRNHPGPAGGRHEFRGAARLGGIRRGRHPSHGCTGPHGRLSPSRSDQREPVDGGDSGRDGGEAAALEHGRSGRATSLPVRASASWILRHSTRARAGSRSTTTSATRSWATSATRKASTRAASASSSCRASVASRRSCRKTCRTTSSACARIWREGCCAFNATLFHTEWNDIQLAGESIDDCVNPPVVGTNLRTQNVASAEAEGLEVELTIAPTESLLFNVNLGLLDTQYVGITTPVPGPHAEHRVQPGAGEDGQRRRSAHGATRRRRDVHHRVSTTASPISFGARRSRTSERNTMGCRRSSTRAATTAS